MPKGDCFQVALALAEAGQREPSTRVCHGWPLSRDPQFVGRRYWHAWVELTTPSGPMVLDWSNDLPHIGLRRVAYYRAGSIQPDQVRRYTYAEAQALSQQWVTYGPWTADWQNATDEHGQAVL